jgi:homoserine kinase
LPLKKGLSSSAALCVLVARAFNRAHGLKLTTRGEMQYAYEGERMTPSQVGARHTCLCQSRGWYTVISVLQLSVLLAVSDRQFEPAT